MKRGILIVILILVLVAAATAFWYYSATRVPDLNEPSTNTPSTGFSPFDRNPIGQNNPVPSQTPAANTGTSTDSAPAPLPVLRLLSNTPVGGYGILSLKSTTTIRWVDRGRGNVYEATNKSADITTLSNTILPRVYNSAWNKSLSAFVGSLLDESGRSINTIYAELRPQTSTSTNGEPNAPFTLRGQDLDGNILAVASSPKKDRVFILVDEGGRGVGYVANYNGQASTKIFETPLTALTVEWPEENTITLVTKAAAKQPGYLYFVNPKTGTWKKIAGPLNGLSARTSPDAKRVLLSSVGSDGVIRTSFINVATKQTSEAIVRTLADKCAWGRLRPEVAYCAAPTTWESGTYPDDWYLGKASFIDKIWSINAVTGEINQISAIIDQSNRLVDAIDLSLDETDQYLVFINKNDLSLWSLDLVGSN